eukprot:Skav226873  [mRNA]  locus=scaffold1187:171428:175948:+ [translate_table: standard]
MVVGASLVLEISSIGSTRCGVCSQGHPATLVTSPSWIKQLMVGDIVCLYNPRATWEDNEMIYHVNQEEGAHMIIRHSPKRGKVAMAELFSGLSGWNLACGIIGEKISYFVEKNPATAQACAEQHGCGVLTAAQFIEEALTQGVRERCVICGDCREPETWVALGLANVGTAMASPPCQPWCSVGRSSGLNTDDGELLPVTGKWAGRLGVALLLLENVAGLPKHTDFPEVIKEIEQYGLTIRIHGCQSINKVMPVRRDRWLATFVQAAVDVGVDRIQLAQSISFDNRSFSSVAVSPSMKDVDAIHVNMAEWERNQLLIPDDAMTMMGNAAFAPGWLKAKVVEPSHDQLIRGRVVGHDQQCTGIMASYSRQHKLPEDLLQSKGLHTSIACDAQGYRYFSPWEFVSLLGYNDQIVLSSDPTDAWLQGGNGLSVAHGWLLLHKTHVLLGDLSPFNPPGSVTEQVQAFQKGAIQLSNYKTVVEGGFWKLQKLECDHVQKKQRVDDIPPTVPFAVDEGETPDAPCATIAWDHEPQFESVADPRCTAVEGDAYQGRMIVIMHEQKHWAMFVNVSSHATVAAIITKGLPHAEEKHFQKFTLGGNDLAWTFVVDCQRLQTLVFVPVSFPITCREESLNIVLQLVIDVTWTGKTAAAFGAVNLGCNPDVLCLCAGSSVVSDDDFLAAYQVEEFTIKFKACMPRYVEWSPVMTQIQDEGMKPVRTGQNRWFVRHPCKKVTRTVVADYDTDVHTLVQRLFPDLHASSTWKVFDSVTEVPGDAFANAWNHLQIQWEGFRPLRITDMHVVSIDMAIDNPVLQAHSFPNGSTRWVRSPFHSKAQQVRIDEGMSWGEVAASFLMNTQIATNVLCLKGQIVLDPSGTVGECEDEGVVSFRLCPMLGGAKFEAIRQRLKTMLEDKGVPADKTLDRLNGFASKASMEKLNQYKDCDDEGFWNHVKTLATDVDFRLITSQELKAPCTEELPRTDPFAAKS